jgi:hypothetical protein
MRLCKNVRLVENRPVATGRNVTPTGYFETYRRSLERPEEFWAEAAEAIDWERRWDRVLEDSRPPFYRWFAGAKLNTCWNALDRHVGAGRGERTALIWDSPVTGRIKRFTYRELRDAVARLAGVLAGQCRLAIDVHDGRHVPQLRALPLVLPRQGRPDRPIRSVRQFAAPPSHRPPQPGDHDGDELQPDLSDR